MSRRLLASIALACVASQAAWAQDTGADRVTGSPFESQLVAATPLDPDPVTVVTTPYGEIVVGYRVVDGYAVAMGDVLVGRIDRVMHPSELTRIRRSQCTDDKTLKAMTPSAGYKWPGGIVPYEIGFFIQVYGTLQHLENAINYAVWYWNTFTDLTFVESPTHPERVKFRFDGFWGWNGLSDIGFVEDGYPQEILLGGGADIYVVNHEIAHAIGLFHEQQRFDRNDHIKVNLECIPVECQPWFPWKDCGFDIIPGYNLVWTDYDYDSIVHYDGRPFDGYPATCRTMERRYTRGPLKYQLGRVGTLDLSPRDLEAINKMY